MPLSSATLIGLMGKIAGQLLIEFNICSPLISRMRRQAGASLAAKTFHVHEAGICTARGLGFGRPCRRK